MMTLKPFLPKGMRPLLTTTLGLVVVAGVLSGPFLLVGCGGAGSAATSTTTTTGRAVLTITWPSTTTATSKLVPVASNSIVVNFSQNGTVIATQTVARPTTGTTSTVTFATLPVGALTAMATAYPVVDGTGTAQATASVAVTIVNGQTTPVSLTMGSTIDHLTVTPTALSLSVGATSALVATAYDANGSVVLASASTITWASAATEVATVDSSGIVTGIAAGTATLTVTETESGKTSTVTTTVSAAATPTPTPTPTPSVNVTITPPSATVGVGLTQAFTASVSGSSDTRVTWSVQEGATGGAITSAGIYTAPTTAGTYHVIATSVADTTKTAMATVTVQSGGGIVIVN